VGREVVGLLGVGVLRAVRALAHAKDVLSCDMIKTLELALSKVAALPDAAQEQIGRELLDRIDALGRLRM
jgi:hypothetical protein